VRDARLRGADIDFTLDDASELRLVGVVEGDEMRLSSQSGAEHKTFVGRRLR
jgi:hypothetical protein